MLAYNKKVLSFFFHTCENVKERQGAWLSGRAVRKERVNYLNTITASNNVHPSLASSLSSHPVHTFGSAFPPDWPNTLSFQSGPSLHRLQTWAASLTTSILLTAHPPCPLLQHVSDFSPLWLQVSWSWQSSLRRGEKARPARQNAI